jgi:hypothetical protein
MEWVMSWGPMVLLSGVWLFFLLKSGRMRTGAMQSEYARLMARQIDLLHAQNQMLDRIAGALERATGRAS